MVFVYPLGIPCLFFFLLYRNRDSINAYYAKRARDNGVQSDGGQNGGSSETLGDDRTVRGEQQPPRTVLVDDLFDVKNKHDEESRGVFSHKCFTILYESYKVWWWEVVESLRRMMLTGLLMLFGQGSGIQVMIGFFVALSSLKRFIFFNPFHALIDNYVAEHALWATVAALGFAMLLRFDTSDEDQADRQIYGVMLCVLALAIPLLIMYFAAKSVVVSQRTMRVDKVAT